MNEIIDELIYKKFREVLNSSRINELNNTAERNEKRLKKILIKNKRSVYSELVTQRI